MNTGEMKILATIGLNIIKNAILGNKTTQIVAGMVIVSTIGASYYSVEASNEMAKLTSELPRSAFSTAIRWYLLYSLFGLLFNFLPAVIFNFVQQMILRKQFVHFLREYMQTNYIEFCKKTPGELRYLIFTKALSVSLATQIVLFDFSLMIWTCVFALHSVVEKGSFLIGILFLVMPVVYLTVLFHYLSKRNEYQHAFLREQEYVSTKLYDKLVNYEIIKAHSLEHTISEVFHTELDCQCSTQISMKKYDAWGVYLLNFALLLPYLLIVGLSWMTGDDGGIKKLLEITMLYFTLSARLKILGTQLIDLVYYLYQIKFSDCAVGEEEGGEETATFNSRIEFRDVTLYHDSTPVVSGINAVIHRGEKIAVVGTNGTGKSTLVKALLGFTRFTGSILFDGVPTTFLSWPSIRRLISYIPQDDYTSDDTVIGNLRLGAPDAPREQIEEVARMYGAHETFSGLERGYDTEAGPRGNRLSGGQRQRMSLVRAAVRDAGMFVMDEATASMDKQYEQQVVGMLFRNLREKTLVMIVHGGEHLERFDRVFFMNEGRLEDTGHFRELLDRSENFRQMLCPD